MPAYPARIVYVGAVRARTEISELTTFCPDEDCQLDSRRALNYRPTIKEGYPVHVPNIPPAKHTTGTVFNAKSNTAGCCLTRHYKKIEVSTIKKRECTIRDTLPPRCKHRQLDRVYSFHMPERTKRCNVFSSDEPCSLHHPRHASV